MFEQKLANLSVYSKSGTVNIRQLPGTDKPVIAKFTNSIGRTSGYYTDKSDGRWYQVNINNPDNPLLKVGYVRFDVVTFAEPVKNDAAASNAQAMMNQLVSQEKEIYKTIIKLAPVLLDLQKKGVNIQNEKLVYKQLVNRLAKRNDALLSSNLVQVTRGKLTGHEKEFAAFRELWNNIGLDPITWGIIIGIVVTALVATTAYYAFKPNYEESKVDFKLSKNLDTALKAKLTTEEYNQLKVEGKKQIDDAFNAGKKQETFSIVSKILLFAGGFIVVDKFILNPKS